MDISPCIAPDGSYLIFSSTRPGGYSVQDLYICFYKGNNEWTAPVNMNSSDAKINIEGYNQVSPSLSPDGKFLFFCNHAHSGNTIDIYWVSITVIDNIKKLISVVCLTILFTTAGSRAGEIHEAAIAGGQEKVQALLKTDPTLLESKDENGSTPLICAYFAAPNFIPQAAVANFLIDQGVNIHAKNNWGATPLYFAIKDFTLMQRLITMGAEVNFRVFDSITPLHQAASSGNLKVARLLIDFSNIPAI
jgi:ankyrin repeat protein